MRSGGIAFLAVLELENEETMRAKALLYEVE
jgi:hypothetical protein